MFLRHVAVATVVACAVAAGPTRAGERLSLDDAYARVLDTHPDLRLADARAAQQGESARQHLAALWGAR